MSAQTFAFNALQALAQKSLSHAHQLPAQIDTVQQWSGIGFSLLGYRFVMPMDDLAEMLEVPSYTRLPGVHPWVKGVSNVRGRLLPLFDLAAFFSGTLNGHKKNQRLLVVEHDVLYAGLWVDRVFGMQHFDNDAKTDAVADGLPSELLPFVDGSYSQGEDQWQVFYAKELSRSSNFLDVASA